MKRCVRAGATASGSLRTNLGTNTRMRSEAELRSTMLPIRRCTVSWKMLTSIVEDDAPLDDNAEMGC